MELYKHYWYWISNTLTATISTLILIILFLLHSYNVIQDLYVKKLMSINTDKDKRKMFEIGSLFTMISIVLFTFVMILTSIISWSFIFKYCFILTLFSTTLYAYAKLIMYLVFLVKLDLVYSNTQYQYPRKYLKTLAVITILHTVLLSVVHIYTYNVNPYIYNHNNLNGIAIKCNSIYNKYVVMSLGLFDIL
eukprot:19540_1